jgi:hypothetical protein
MVNARFYTGLKSVATIMAELGVEGAADLLKRIHWRPTGSGRKSWNVSSEPAT